MRRSARAGWQALRSQVFSAKSQQLSKSIRASSSVEVDKALLQLLGASAAKTSNDATVATVRSTREIVEEHLLKRRSGETAASSSSGQTAEPDQASSSKYKLQPENNTRVLKEAASTSKTKGAIKSRETSPTSPDARNMLYLFSRKPSPMITAKEQQVRDYLLSRPRAHHGVHSPRVASPNSRTRGGVTISSPSSGQGRGTTVASSNPLGRATSAVGPYDSPGQSLVREVRDELCVFPHIT
ncbi:unnamed protein product, partial [Amoebophrya sp. A25]|eukprot:GSA25T00015928001.1